MSRQRTMVFWALLAAFAAAVAWWTLVVPYAPDRVFTAIPANASFVSVHDNLASRWKDVGSNQLAGLLVRSIGLEPEAAAALLSDPATEEAVRRFGSRRVAIAYVPSLGPARAPAWVVATWIGGQSQRLRWQLKWSRGAGLQVIRDASGRTIWSCRLPDGPRYLRFSFVLDEGMLLGCLSVDQTAARHLGAIADRTSPMPSVAALGKPDQVARWLPPPGRARDRAWTVVPRLAPDAAFPSTIAIALTGLAAGPTDGQLAMDSALPSAPPLPPAHAAELAALLGDAPQAIALCPTAWVRSLAIPATPASFAPLADALMGSGAISAPSNTAAVVLLGDSYSGRLKSVLGPVLGGLTQGLKVPAILLAIRVGNRAGEAEALILESLDSINSRFRLGLIPHRIPTAAGDIVCIEDTQNTVYGRFALEERVAYAVRGSWLILASNMASLQKVLADAGSRTPGRPGEAAWAAGVADRPAAGYVWVDLDASGRTVKAALGAYALTLMGDRSLEGTRRRRVIEDAIEQADRARALRCVTAWMESEPRLLRVPFRIGL